MALRNTHNFPHLILMYTTTQFPLHFTSSPCCLYPAPRSTDIITTNLYTCDKHIHLPALTHMRMLDRWLVLHTCSEFYTSQNYICRVLVVVVGWLGGGQCVDEILKHYREPLYGWCTTSNINREPFTHTLILWILDTHTQTHISLPHEARTHISI